MRDYLRRGWEGGSNGSRRVISTTGCMLSGSRIKNYDVSSIMVVDDCGRR